MKKMSIVRIHKKELFLWAEKQGRLWFWGKYDTLKITKAKGEKRCWIL